MASNDPRFLSPMGSRLAELGLDIHDVNVGRYIQIDLSKPRHEPEEFAEFGEFDTFVVLNPHDLPADAQLWVYFNNKRPESRMPLHRLSRLETVADRFYLQHSEGWEGVTLEVIIGGDLRALSVEPKDKGSINVSGSSILEAVRALLASLVENDVVIGLLADRPPASEMRGRGYYAWDAPAGQKLTYSNGTTWVVNQ